MRRPRPVTVEDVMAPQIHHESHPVNVNHTPVLLRVLTYLGVVFGTIAIALAGVSIVGEQRLAAQRNTDRIASELASCQRGNAVRVALSDFMTAVESNPLPANLQQAAATFSDKVAPINCNTAIIGASDVGSSP